MRRDLDGRSRSVGSGTLGHVIQFVAYVEGLADLILETGRWLWRSVLLHLMSLRRFALYSQMVHLGVHDHTGQRMHRAHPGNADASAS